MPYSFCLIYRLQMSLIILLAVRATDIKKKFCQIEIFFFACRPVKFNKSHLNNLMSGINFHPVPTKILINQVCRFQCYVKQSSFSGSLVMCNCCLIKMPKIIKLMTQNRIHFPPVFAYPFMQSFASMHFCNGTVCIKISIIFLCQTNFIDEGIEIGIQF